MTALPALVAVGNRVESTDAIMPAYGFQVRYRLSKACVSGVCAWFTEREDAEAWADARALDPIGVERLYAVVDSETLRVERLSWSTGGAR